MNPRALLSGGIGDVIVSIGIFNKLKERVPNLEAVTYHPHVYKFFQGELSDTPNPNNPCENVHFYMNHFGMLVNPHPDLLDFKRVNQEFIDHHKLQHYVNLHPLKDGISADIMGDKGFNRETLPAAMFGLSNVPFVRSRPESLGWFKEKYITVHDGFGAPLTLNISRATKTWDITHWNYLVTKIKEQYPEYKIIQIGGELSRRIKACDYRFLDSFSIDESFKILAHSSLHIDTDSGLVHAAHAFGVKSVVMFGSTPANYFGYKENINIQSPICKPCWWSTDTWVQECPRGYKVPSCMNAIFPDKVFSAVQHALK